MYPQTKYRITVCLATYNGAPFIHDQMRSILRQLSYMDEVIVSDDGSKDRTIQIIKNFNDPRIRILTNPCQKGVVSNFENALHAARGRYVFLSDQDDIWAPAKVQIMLSGLQDYDLVVSDCTLIDRNEKIIYPSYFALRRSGKGVCKNIFANTYIGACMAFTQNILKKALPFPKNIPMHDWWIGLVGEMFGNTHFCQDKLVYYRRHAHNLSPLVTNKKFSLVEKICMRRHIVVPLVKRMMQNKSIRLG